MSSDVVMILQIVRHHRLLSGRPSGKASDGGGVDGGGGRDGGPEAEIGSIHEGPTSYSLGTSPTSESILAKDTEMTAPATTSTTSSTTCQV